MVVLEGPLLKIEFENLEDSGISGLSGLIGHTKKLKKLQTSQLETRANLETLQVDRLMQQHATSIHTLLFNTT